MVARILASVTAAIVAAGALTAQTAAVAKAANAGNKTSQVPRLADGHPSLQGIWTNATITPLERPAQYGNKLTLNDKEAAQFEHQNNDNLYTDRRSSDAERDRDHAYNSLFFDRGTELARVDGVKRTSLIIDPPDGKLPPLTPQARERISGRVRNSYDSVKNRPLGERCILGFGSTSGPPMMPVLYNNNYQIVQTPSTIMIMVEMVHDVRKIHMDRRQHLPQNIRLWNGDSIGRWEGDTLVVDTTNFTDKTSFRGSSPNMQIVERFTRTDEGTILYKWTITDPESFTKPFTAEYPFLAAQGPVYEYACHEGNYAMPDILGGARKMDAAGRENR